MWYYRCVMKKLKKIKLALIGYGHVGQAFARMLSRKKDWVETAYNVSPVITAICTRSKGGAINPDGLNPIDIPFDKTMTAHDVIQSVDYDVMVELTPLNIKTGEPAITHIETALTRDKHVITANKGPLAWAYRDLKQLAADHHVCFYYEATVMDGVPVFNLAHDTLPGCNITAVTGILNSTTNFVLAEMAKGRSMADAIRAGQVNGFVERDPAMDLDGFDAAAKLAVLMNVLMNTNITPDAIRRTGISDIHKADLERAHKNHQRIKLMCRGKLVNGVPVGTVAPEAVDENSLYATVDSTASAITLTTDLMGDISIVEHPFEPEIDHTAYGIFSDLMRIIHRFNQD